MDKPVNFGCILGIAFAVILRETHGVQSVEQDTLQGLPCKGLKNYIGDPGVAVCAGAWTGDIAQANDICRGNWHVCTWTDNDVIEKITWYEANHISGCYAINAAHDGETCSSCSGKSSKAEMAAIGADCVRYNETSKSCFGKGRIDASFTSITQYTPCHIAPWISGVLCCVDKTEGRQAIIGIQPEPYIYASAGSQVAINCQADGVPEPTYQWLHNGKPMYSDMKDGKLIISSATVENSGYWECIAKNRYGQSVSWKSRLRVTKATTAAIGCKDNSNGKILASANIAVCNGNWSGHVRQASKHLCARGWRVCSVEDMHDLFYVSYKEASIISGCYAYNAASSKFYPCAKCSQKSRNNRMSGIGNGCGSIAETRSSCLNRGRIDVYSKSNENFTNKQLRSCRFVQGITTGVSCCKRNKTSVKKNLRRKFRKGKKAARLCRCKNGGICRDNTCKCASGYRGRHCERRSRPKQRAHVKL